MVFELFYFADSQQPPYSPFAKGEFKRNKEAKFLGVPILIGTRMSENAISLSNKS